MKKIFVCIGCLFVIFLSTSSVSGVPTKYKAAEKIETFWWPGNPNPQPGSEAWLQLYGGYQPSSSGIARECAMKALIGSGLTGGIELWIAKGALSVLSFARSFGIGWAVSYCGCITGLW